MKSIKYLLWSFLAAGALLSACTEDDNYAPGDPESGAGVGFSSEAKTTFTIADDTFVEVPVLRSNASEQLTVSVVSSTASTALTIPSSVSFAAGETVAPLKIYFDLEQFEYDTTHSVDLKLDAGANATAYKPQSISVTIRRPAPWISLGIATYTDDFVTTFYVVENETYEVEIQENQNIPGFYRLVNPYGEAYPNNDPGDWDESQDYYMEIHAEDPDAVWIPVAGMGFDWGKGEFIFGSLAGYYIGNGASTVEQQKAAGNCGTLKDGVITFPTRSLLATRDGESGLYYANNNGAFQIVFPGVVLADYSIETELSGYFNSVSGEYFAVVDVELGEDVEYALVASAAGTDADALYKAIIAGEADCVELTASGQAKVPAAEGKNVVVAVSFSGDEPQEDASLTFSFYAGEDTRLPYEKDAYTKADIFGDYKDAYLKDWNMYAIDYFGETGEREFLNVVTIADADDYFDEEEEYDVDAVSVSGLTLGALDDDAVIWEYYDGFIYQLNAGEVIGQWSYRGVTYDVTPYIYNADDDKIYSGSNTMIGGFVEDGYIAFVNRPNGYNFNGLYIDVTNIEDPDDYASLAFYTEIVLEDSALATESLTAKALTTKTQLKTMAKALSTPQNFVELRGRERAHALIDELNAKNASKAKKTTEPVIELISTSKASKDVKKEMKPATAVSL